MQSCDIQPSAKSKHHENCFSIKSDGVFYRISAKSASEHQEWVQAILSCSNTAAPLRSIADQSATTAPKKQPPPTPRKAESSVSQQNTPEKPITSSEARRAAAVAAWTNAISPVVANLEAVPVTWHPPVVASPTADQNGKADKPTVAPAQKPKEEYDQFMDMLTELESVSLYLVHGSFS